MIDSVEPSNWTSVDVALLITLLPLLFLSAFFSCSETAFFRLGQAQLVELRKRKTQPANSVLYIVKNRRNVLITILIGNMTANVLYFVVGSVLMLHAPGNISIEICIAVGTLFSIVIFGEVLPKMAATARPIGIAMLLAPPLSLIHRLLTPIRNTVDALVISPLSRLASSSAPDALNAAELASLVELSSTEGIIDQDEQRILFEVVELGRIRVREVMTPRVHMISSPSSTSEKDLRKIIDKSRLTQIPIYGEDIDDITGMLHTKRYLQRSNEGQTLMQVSMTKPQFIPQVATLDQLLNHFRETSTRIAIVVDEFGGTAGLVTLEDILEELIGEIGDGDHFEIKPPEQCDDGKWKVDANTAVRGWAAAMGSFIEHCPAATMGGLIAAKLGRIPEVGDTVQFSNLELKVSSMDEYRVATVLVSLVKGGEA
jgi:CBS domain containing-hemolysin-like protein